ncbi:hypothetical protein M5E88_00400 [Akkermansia muciniphila]|nr:hypothetical protein M5E88_00400 [Akkermansia muciniphila]
MKAWRNSPRKPSRPACAACSPSRHDDRPHACPHPRAHGQFRFQITVKGPSARILSRTLRKLVQEAGLGKT